MSNRKRLKVTRGPRCPKCKSRDSNVKNYSDAILRICNECQFPVREVKK